MSRRTLNGIGRSSARRFLLGIVTLTFVGGHAPPALAQQRSGESAFQYEQRLQKEEKAREKEREEDLKRIERWSQDAQRNQAEREKFLRGGGEGKLTPGERQAYEYLIAYTDAVLSGDESSLLRAADLGKKIGEYKDALKWYRQAATKGSPRAKYEIAVLYGRGLGTPKDQVEAYRWCESAAESGYPQAQYETGALLKAGIGVQADPVRALEWIKKAADQGYRLAFGALGDAYFMGDGVKKDAKKAFDFYMAGAKNGDAHAQIMVAAMCDAGVGTQPSATDATSWYAKSAAQGNALADKFLNHRPSRDKMRQDVKDAHSSSQ